LVLTSAGPGSAADAAGQRMPAAGGRVAVETVYFGDARHSVVQVMRGLPRPPPPAPPPASTQIVTFATGCAESVKIVRGMGAIPASLTRRVEKVQFSDPLLAAVTVIRGTPSREQPAFDLFGPANGGELDRIAFAVDGVESRHGADLRMWRPEASG